MRALVAYAPALVLLIAGAVVLLAFPFGTAVPCDCPTNEVCSCPPMTAYNPAGPILLLGAGVYALGAFIFRLARDPRNASPTAGVFP